MNASSYEVYHHPVPDPIRQGKCTQKRIDIFITNLVRRNDYRIVKIPGVEALHKQTWTDRVHYGNMKIYTLRESPASGPLRGTVGQECSSIFKLKPPQGRPVGGGGVHRNS